MGQANHRKGVDVWLIITPVLFQIFAEGGGGMKVERLVGGWQGDTNFLFYFST